MERNFFDLSHDFDGIKPNLLSRFRNDIDDPIEYYLNPIFEKAKSRFMAYIFEQNEVPLILVADKLSERRERTRNELASIEYYINQLADGEITFDEAMAVLDLSITELADLLQEKIEKRDAPIFDAYLQGKEVKLPFSEKESKKYRKIMAEERYK